MDSLPPKTCTKCKLPQPRENYHKCGTTKDGLNSSCKECKKAAARAWHHANPERARAKNLAWRKANPEKKAASVRAWCKANPERARANNRAGNRAWHHANPEKAKAKHQAWREAKPENVKANSQRRRARLLMAVGSYTAVEWKAKLELYKGRCHWCHEKISGITHADHVIPLAKGGSNYIENLVPSCARCNISKGAKLPHEFAGRLF